MKIDRRCFLSLGVGAAAGTALSPLPWKLTDDLSIWTQMWPWTPVPKAGEVNYVKSVSTLCQGKCGISVRKVDDRAVKIEGLAGYPGSDGNACNLCLSGLQLLYGPDKIKTPLKRVGERGEGKWQKIPWNQALEEVAARLMTIRNDGKASTVACILGEDSGTVPALFKRFLTIFGSPNFFKMPSHHDSYELALKLMHGKDARPGYDVEQADFIVSFGAGVLDGWGASVRMFKAKSAWQDKKAKFIQIEPRLSNTAAKADAWIPIRPGTEGLVALAMAHVMISEGTYHKDFVEKHAQGFEDWTGSDGTVYKGFKTIVTEHFSPSRVAGSSGVNADVIIAMAREFAKASHPLALCGRGKGKTSGALHETLAVHALNALAGNINRPGGVWAIPAPDYIRWPEASLDDVAVNGVKTPRVDGAGTPSYPLARYLLHRLPQVMAEAKSELPVQALLVGSDANPCYDLPGGSSVRNALNKIPFIVSFAGTMNETALYADIILPDLGHLERYEDVPAPSGMNRPMIGLARPVITPKGQAKHIGDALLLLTRAMGGSIADAFPWETYQTCLEETLGDNWKLLNEAGVIINESFQPDVWEKAFATESKKFVFMSEACKSDSEKGGIRPVQPEGAENAFPLLLIPYDSMRIVAGPVSDTPFVMKTIEDTVLFGKECFVEVNPKTGGECGLADGIGATLATPKGAVRVKVHFSNGIQPGVVAMPRGLGRFGVSDYMAGKGVNVNDIIGPMEDPASGLDAAWGIRAKLTIA